jgi:signal transduction histidine kinase
VLLGLVVRSLGPAIDAAGATVEIPDVLPAVRGDATQLGQLLQNLIANAVKFRAPGRPPRVTLGARDDGSGLRLWVADDGIGIAEAHQERIFKMFARLHGRDEYEGTGIGLALCRRIAERHGGRIWVEPGAAGGSVFHVWIPSS